MYHTSVCLKRYLSIFFTLLFLFNVVGYYLVYLGLRTTANMEMRARLDAKAYDDSEVLTVKTPFTAPYQTNWNAFDRIDGEFEHNGIFYNLINYSIERDTLVIVYIKNQKGTNLYESLTQFVHASTDTPMSKKAGKIIEHFTKDYLFTTSTINQASAGWLMECNFCSQCISLEPITRQVNSPPPKAIA